MRVDTSLPVPAQNQIRDGIIKEIASGKLAIGERVPSIRALSTRLGVSQAVIRRAFEQLLAEGWLETRHGSGTFVSAVSKLLLGRGEHGQHEKPHSTFTWMREHEPIRESFSEFFQINDVDLEDAEAGLTQSVQRLYSVLKHNTSMGIKPLVEGLNFIVDDRLVDPLRGARWENALEKWREDCELLTTPLSEPAGFGHLREQIAQWLRTAKGMNCAAADVVLVNGASEARSLIARLLIDEGTKIIFEDPGNLAARLHFESFGGVLVPISIDESGIVTEELETIKDANLIYVTPASQYPTGAVFSRARKQKIVEWAVSSQSLIIEDESRSEFTYESRVTPSIAALDPEGRTIYIGSFAQIIPSDWRIAFMVVPKALRMPIARLKSVANRCTAPIVQVLLQKLFETGFLREHIRRLQRICEERRSLMLTELESWKQDGIFYTPVKGGLFQTIWLPPGVSDLEMQRRCLAKNIAVTPCSPCYMRQPARSGLMLNFGVLTTDEISIGLKTIRKIMTEG